MEEDIEAKLSAWKLETGDIRGRVRAAVGAETTLDFQDLVDEIRALRREIGDLRRSIALLQHDTDRLRAGGSTPVRIAAYAPVESLVRLS